MGLEARLARLEQRLQPPPVTEETLIAVYYTDNGAAPAPGDPPDHVVYYTAAGVRLDTLPPGVNRNRIKVYGPGMEDV